MALDDAAEDRKRRRFIASLNEQIATLTRCRDDLVKLLNTFEGSNPVKDVLTFFDERWMQAYRSQEHYKFIDADAGNVKRLLKTLDVNTLQRRIARYLNDGDRWLVEQKHPMNIFVKRVNSYGEMLRAQPVFKIDPENTPAPSDCAHRPMCSTAFEHTEKMIAEMKQV